jgi:hypothetical protein
VEGRYAPFYCIPGLSGRYPFCEPEYGGRLTGMHYTTTRVAGFITPKFFGVIESMIFSV